MLTVSDGAEKLARNLMRALFDESELVGRSLFGKVCNANKLLPTRPAIDQKRRDAIIRNFYDNKTYIIMSRVLEQSLELIVIFSVFVMKKFGVGHSKKGKNPVLNSVHRSMGDMLRTLTRKS